MGFLLVTSSPWGKKRGAVGLGVVNVEESYLNNFTTFHICESDFSVMPAFTPTVTLSYPNSRVS